MKDFFGEWGWTLVTAIIATIVIVMAKPIGELMQESFLSLIRMTKDWFDTFVPTACNGLMNYVFKI